MQESSEFIIDQILPTQEVHLIAGPSGSGKTRWLMDTLLDWQEGKPILGYRSFPVPWVYVSSDRSQRSVKRTLSKMGIPFDKVPALAAWGEHIGISGIYDAIEKSQAKLAVIESFGSFVDPPGNSNCVKQFLKQAYRFMDRSGCTIWGVMESPKLKPFEKYENPRQRVSGAASWAHFSETIFVLEPSDPKYPQDPNRILYVCPRNEPGLTQHLCFDNIGHLKVNLKASSGDDENSIRKLLKTRLR